MTKLKKLAGDTILYGLGNIIPRFLNLILFPIHTKQRFNPEEYGVFVKLMSIVAFMNIVYSFGMETGYFRFATKPGADPKRIYRLAMTVVIVIGFVLSGVIILAADPIAAMLSVGNHPDFIIWLAVIMFLDNIAAIPFARLRLEKKPLQFAIYRITNVMVVVVLNLYFLFVIYDSSVGIGYIFLSILIANTLYLVFFFKDFITWRPLFDKEISMEMTRYSFPIVLTGLLAMTNEFFSRVSLERWLPKDFYEGRTSAFAVGVFGACYRFAVLMNLAVQAFRMAAEPFFFSNAQEKDSPKLFASVNHYFTIVCCFILIGVCINMDVLKYLMGEEYWEGIGVVLPLSLGYMFFGIYYNITAWYKLTDRTIVGTYITVGGAVATIGLNFVLIPIYGYIGSAWATTIVYGSMMVVCYLLGQRYYPVPYKVLNDLTYVLTSVLLVYAVNSFKFENLIVGMTVHALVLITWVAVVYLVERKNYPA